MNLKEAFRYQNYLEELFQEASSNIGMSSCLKYIYNHKKSKVNPDAEDTVEERSFSDYDPDQLVSFLDKVLSERKKLSEAIAIAKAEAPIDIDVAIEINKARRRMIGCLKNILKYRQSKKTDTGVDYKFNAAGDQVSYRYEIEVEAFEKYDRKEVKQLYRNMLAEADNISTTVDEILITTGVAYEPLFFVEDSFEEVFESFANEEE